LLSARPLWLTTDVRELQRLMQSEQPTDIQSLVPDLPDRAAELVRRALEHNRERRFQSMDEFKSALDLCAEENAQASTAPMEKPPTAPSTEAVQLKPRHIRAALLTGAAALTIGVVLGWFALKRHWVPSPPQASAEPVPIVTPPPTTSDATAAEPIEPAATNEPATEKAVEPVESVTAARPIRKKSERWRHAAHRHDPDAPVDPFKER
jgi:hypothetical protein